MSGLENNPFKGLKLPEVKFDLPDLSAVNKSLNSAVYQIEKENQRKEDYKNELLQSVKNIEANTYGLNEIVPLLASNIDNQEKILEVLKEALSIGTSTTEEEAKTMYRKFMNTANQTVEDVETMEKVLGFGKTIYNMAVAYIKFKVDNGG